MLLILAFVLLLAALAALGAALTKDEAPTGVARALAALERQGTGAGRDLTEQADPPFGERIVEPLQRKALAFGRRITGADKAERIRHRLDLAGNPRDWSVDRVVALKVIAGVALPAVFMTYGLLLGLSLRSELLLALAGVAIGFFAPDLYLYQCAAKRADQIRKSLADAVDLLTISVEAGLGFDAAVQQVARNTNGPLAEEFARVLREMQLGKGRADALRGMSDRTNVEDVHTFVGAMVQADAFGISIGEVLRVQSNEMRLKRRQYAEEKAQQVPVKIMIPLILFILPCLFVVVMGPAVLSAIDAFTGS
ncbi:tight adherence protein C [Nocardioides thalensis]|uniref:Tight adherence protein C n=1 Tax=Nocardioides thalensis TaxID=1914755 RepID=A0A853C3R1_9ACTN|nr:type II secretion system F family protein [Nocardioides thalensis]NYJ01939.1 tight adherence protein C [Nocardioides thalensis]